MADDCVLGSIDGVPVAENETSNHVLQNVKSVIEKSSSEIPNLAIDRAKKTLKQKLRIIKHTS